MKTLQRCDSIEELIRQFKADSAISGMKMEEMEELVANIENDEFVQIYGTHYLPDETIGQSFEKIFQYQSKEECFKALFTGLLNMIIKEQLVQWAFDRPYVIKSILDLFK